MTLSDSLLQNRLRALPAVDKLLASAAGQLLIAQYGYEPTLNALRTALETTRSRIRAGDAPESVPVDADALLTQAQAALETDFLPSLRPVINATGVIIHTNLGRAPLAASARQAMIDIATGYSTLEFDLATGKRGSRLVHAGDLLAQITGAEAALVVNNNAAATVLLLAALARGKEVIVSRGQLVEIGGGFRVPDIMRQSGAKLVEVGTTNRTRAADYERAITDRTALLLRVHSSNFKQIGFTEQPELAELAEIAHRHNLLLVDDLGSGALLDTAPFGLDHEPMVQESLAAGVDLVAFSGDKLLGGPQAGILVGRQAIIDQLKRHPLARAIRADKLCLAALTATLDHYRRGDALSAIPIWQMMTRTPANLKDSAAAWMLILNENYVTLRIELIDGESMVGGGSLPGTTLPTTLLSLTVPRPDALMAALRQTPVPVIARILEQRVVFDPRTVLPEQTGILLQTITAAVKAVSSGNQPSMG